MKYLGPVFFALSILVVAPATAQETSPDEVEDVVVATGQVQGTDPAMSAFLNGDYETAEVEFKKNFSNLLRQESLEFQALRQTQNNAINQQILNGPPDAGAQGGQAVNNVTPNGFDVRGLNQAAKREADSESRIGSGDDLGYQLYMAGMSQVQLEKFDEAKISFTRALRRTKNLHDARLRLGLLELKAGNTTEAQRHYNKLLRAQKTCKSRCDRSESIDLGVETLGGLLGENS